MPTTLEEQKDRAREEGWGWSGEGMETEQEVLHLLTALVLVTKPDVCVETGTYHGHGTKAIVQGLMANDRGHLWTVENDHYLVEKLEQLTIPRTTLVEADSAEWSANEAPSSINFALVDCSPETGHRVEVFKNLLPKMKRGGLICCHDAYFMGQDYFNALCGKAGRPPNLYFPTLNGIAIWAT